MEDPNSLGDLAKVCENAERFEDMCVAMAKKVELNKDLDVDSRNLLSVAYKNVVGVFRNARRRLEEDTPELEDHKGPYRAYVESQLEIKCKEVLKLLNDHLLDVDNINKWAKAVSDNDEESKKNFKGDANTREAIETQVFYLKMCGDYYRYLAELVKDAKDQGKALQAYARKSTANYNMATHIAGLALPATHPTRLGLALNSSVCYYEILGNSKKACKIAKDAFDEAIQKLDSLNDSTYKDSTLIMQLLRDNLTIWKTDEDDAAKEEV